MFSVSVQKEEGMLLKAVNYAGEMFIIEEVQLFQPPVSVKILKFSNVTVSDVQCYHSWNNGLLFLNPHSSVHPLCVMVKYISVMSVCLQGQLYAGSDNGAAQIPLATCERSLSCMDCVLARDPYCGWDKVVGKCTLVSSSQRYKVIPTSKLCWHLYFLLLTSNIISFSLEN